MLKEITNPVKAIRAKCLDCCCGSRSEVELCTCDSCPLYPFRFGKNPYRSVRKLSDEQRMELAGRLAKARNAAEVQCENGKDYQNNGGGITNA